MATIQNCIIKLSGNQSIASSSTDVLITYDSVVKDTGSWFNTTTHQFKPDESGYFIVENSCNITNSAANYSERSRIRKNGSLASMSGWQYYSSTVYPTHIANDLIYLNGSTDYIDFAVDNRKTTINTLWSTYTRATISGPFTVADGFDMVRVRMSASRTTANATDTVINYDTEDFDTNGTFAAKTLTPTKAGLYLVFSSAEQVMTASTVKLFKTWMRKGGSGSEAGFEKYTFAKTGNYYATTLRWVYFDGSSDYIDFLVRQEQGSSSTLRNYAYATYAFAVGPFITGTDFVAADVGFTSNQAIGSSGAVAAYDDENYDTGGNWALKQFTAPEDGCYSVVANAKEEHNHLRINWEIFIRKGGTKTSRAMDHNYKYFEPSTQRTSELIYLNKDDVVDIYLDHEFSSLLAYTDAADTFVQVVGPMENASSGGGGGGGGSKGFNKNAPDGLGNTNGLMPNRLG